MVSFQSPAGDGKPIAHDPPERYRGVRIALAFALLGALEVSPLVLWMLALWAFARWHR
jgi:hypothetical protein